jgi:lipoprotein Spr
MKKILSYILLALIIVSCHSKKSTVSSTKHANYDLVKNTVHNSDKEMNSSLYKFIVEWYGVPYKYGSCSKDGVDCSGFVNLLYKTVYSKTLERKSDDIFHKQCKKISKQDVREGDLVFFKIDSKEITHVGVYLKNDKFVHASTKKGVMISDLNEPYFQKYFYAFGRVK